MKFEYQGFWAFYQNPLLKVSNFCMMVEGNREHHLSMMSQLGEIVIL